MVDPIVVLNAGSSSLKFSVFVASGGGLEPDLRGNIEEIDTAPRFVARDRAGHVLAEWGEGARLGHEGALDHRGGRPGPRQGRPAPPRPITSRTARGCRTSPMPPSGGPG